MLGFGFFGQRFRNLNSVFGKLTSSMCMCRQSSLSKTVPSSWYCREISRTKSFMERAIEAEDKTRSWGTGRWVGPGGCLNLLQGSNFQSDKLFAAFTQPPVPY